MNHCEYLRKIALLVKLLQAGNTGPANQLAKNLMISRRTLFRYMEDLRMSGAEIHYSKSTNSYKLESKFCFFEDFLKSAI